MKTQYCKAHQGLRYKEGLVNCRPWILDKIKPGLIGVKQGLKDFMPNLWKKSLTIDIFALGEVKNIINSSHFKIQEVTDINEITKSKCTM